MISSTQTNHPLQGTTGPCSEPKARLQAACSRLRDAGLRITQPRIAILSVLIGRDQPISIEQIHAELETKSCDLVTVYRCLSAFEDIGLVRRSFFHNGTSLYILGDRKETAYHIVSKESQDIRELDSASSAQLAAAIKLVEEKLKAAGYENVSHVVEFFAKSPEAVAARASKNVAVPEQD
jgi:Fur family transcriptional regulator, ferric uptake regulator